MTQSDEWLPRPGSQTTWCQMGRCEKAGGTSGNYRDEENELKTWPATPVRSVVRFSSLGRYGLVGMLPVEAGAAGAGQPFNKLAIAKCQLVYRYLGLMGWTRFVRF